MAALRQQHTAPLRASGRIHRIALTGTVAPQRRKNTATSSSPIKRIMGQQHRRHAPTASTTPTHRLTVASCPRVQRGLIIITYHPTPRTSPGGGQLTARCNKRIADRCRRTADRCKGIVAVGQRLASQFSDGAACGGVGHLRG